MITINGSARFVKERTQWLLRSALSVMSLESQRGYKRKRRVERCYVDGV